MLDLPDWNDEPCAILAPGQTLERRHIALAIEAGCNLVAINLAATMAPEAAIVYACDRHFWHAYWDQLKDHTGLKVTQDEQASKQYSILRMKLLPESRMILKPGFIGSGGNGGFQALNIAIHTKANPIYLLGYDMWGKHFHPDHDRSKHLNTPTDKNFQSWIAAFNEAAPDIERLGVKVFNCTAGSKLTAFPFRSIEEI